MFASFISCLTDNFSIKNKIYLMEGLNYTLKISHIDNEEGKFNDLYLTYFINNLNNQDNDTMNGVILGLNSFIDSKINAFNIH